MKIGSLWLALVYGVWFCGKRKRLVAFSLNSGARLRFVRSLPARDGLRSFVETRICF